MTWGASRFRYRAWARTPAHLPLRASRWWIAEFLDLFPQQIAKWLAGPGRGTLALLHRGEALRLELLDHERQVLAATEIAASRYSPAFLDQFLRAHGFQRNDVDIGVRLLAEQVFHRKLVLPAQAANSIPEIIAQDVARKTPFRLPDVYHGHSVPRADGAGKIVVWQWLVRRGFVDDAVVPFGLQVDDLAFATAEGDNADLPAPFIALRPEAKVRNSAIKRCSLALCCSAAVLSLTVGNLKYWHQQSLIDANDAEIAIAQVKAQKVRSEIEKIEKKETVLRRLRAQRNVRPGLLDLWEEATRVLPAHSWLTELRLSETPEKNEQWVGMTGFSAAATDLVRLLHQSQLLADASLTSPVALDPVEGRERFAIQARIRGFDTYKEAAR